MHFQRNYPQAKLIRVTRGVIFDVVVDLRDGSSTYGSWHGEILSADNARQMLVPKGFAHGFLVLSDEAEFVYKCDDFYHPEDEGGIMWNDEEVGIVWPGDDEIILSEKDKLHPSLKESKIKF